jgi:hypothetical protein
MPQLLSLADFRDGFIIVYGTLGIIFFAVAIFVTLFTFFAVKGLLGKVNTMMDESIKPAVASIKDAADTVRGTTEFVGKTAVTPIARTYGAFAGLRKGLSVLGGLSKLKR